MIVGIKKREKRKRMLVAIAIACLFQFFFLKEVLVKKVSRERERKCE